jgi:hypothetical protein
MDNNQLFFSEGLVSVARSGNAIMTYQNNQLNIAMAANIRQIAVSERFEFLENPLSKIICYRLFSCPVI